MKGKKLKKYSGGSHKGTGRTAPYPVSRLAPAADLVDLAKEIAGADLQVNNRATAKLTVIADQIRALQAEARAVLDEARESRDLHRARCNFIRRPGHIYHLYQGPDGPYFSMLSPSDWRDSPPHPHLGSYRLENDMSWTPEERLNDEDDSDHLIARLLEE